MTRQRHGRGVKSAEAAAKQTLLNRRAEQVFFVMKEGVVYRNDRAPSAPTVER